MDSETRTEKVTLEDGRHAERHTFFNEDGQEVVEVYSEPKKVLNLDKRVINTRKEIIAEQRIQTIRDGQVVDEEVHSIEPEIKLEKRRHFVSDDDESLTRHNLSQAVAEGVIEAMKVNREYEPKVIERIVEKPVEKIVEVPVEVEVEKIVEVPVHVKEPLFSKQKVSAQSVVENRVEEKRSQGAQSIVGYWLIAIAEIAIIAYLIF